MKKINRYDQYLTELHLNPFQMGKKKWSLPNNLTFYSKAEDVFDRSFALEFDTWLHSNLKNLFVGLSDYLTEVSSLDYQKQIDLLKEPLSVQNDFGDFRQAAISNDFGLIKIYEIDSILWYQALKNPGSNLTTNFLYVLIDQSDQKSQLNITLMWVVYSFEKVFSSLFRGGHYYYYTPVTFTPSDKISLGKDIATDNVFPYGKVSIYKNHQFAIEQAGINNEDKEKAETKKKIIASLVQQRTPYFNELQECIIDLTLNLQDLLNGEGEVQKSKIDHPTNLLKIIFMEAYVNNDLDTLTTIVRELNQVKKSLDLPFGKGTLNDYVQMSFSFKTPYDKVNSLHLSFNWINPPKLN